MAMAIGSFVVLQPISSRGVRSISISASVNSNGAVPSAAKGRMVIEIPLDKIRRPLMRTRANDQQKVKELMDSISEIGLQVPVNSTVTFNASFVCYSLIMILMAE